MEEARKSPHPRGTARLVVVIGVCILMSRQQVQYLIDAITLGTLANNTAIIGNTNVDASREQGVRLKQLKAAYLLTGQTGDEGPIIYGWAVELTAVEIAEAILADPQDSEDTAARDKANRKVFPMGMFGVSTQIEMNQPLREVKFPWKEIIEGATLKWFVFNASGSTLTTGAIAHLFAATVQEWSRD